VPTADVRGLRIEYESLGDPSKPTVLLIMGLGQQLVAWPDDFCEMLVGSGFRVVRYDHRDTGLSSKIEGRGEIGVPQAFMRLQMALPVPAPYTLEDLADDAEGLAEQLGLERFHVLGVSMGGMIGQILAARHPRRVVTLTSVMSTSGEKHLPPGRPDALALLARPRPKGGREALIDFGVTARRLLAGPGYPTSEEEMRAMSARAIDRAWYPPGFGRHTLAVLASPDRKDRLERLRVPTLVVHGRDDPLVPPAHGARVAELVPGASLEVVDGMGHDLAPGVRELLARFVADHVRAASTGA
jgi:pimeloyl-ACP methyl ester carboxylesterase